MLDNAKLTEILREVVGASVSEVDLERILTRPTTDSEGNEALRIVVVLTPEAARRMTGDKALDLLVGIQRILQNEGEERFPIVEYATEQELALEDGPEEADLNEEDA